MINKIILFTLMTFVFSNAAVQEVRVGTIDNYYASKLSKNKLKQIIVDIEKQFENQLDFDVFNYSISGKPIDIVYMPPLELEKRILRETDKLNKKIAKIENLKTFFLDEQKRIEASQETLNKFASHINEMRKSLDKYIKNTNKRKDLTSAEYKNVQTFVQNKQNRIERDVNNLRKERRILRRMWENYNKKTYTINNLINEYNRLSSKITRMTSSVKTVKGKTFGIEEVNLQTYYKDGEKVKKRQVKNSMTKIEIYGFETIEELKAVLAHEIGHLVGIPHINAKNALMNPLLQQNQIEKLSLITADIENFKRNF